MEQNNYFFCLELEGIKLNIGGDQQFVETMLKKWKCVFEDKLPASLREGEAVTKEKEGEPKAPASSRVTILDFMKSKTPKTLLDQIMVTSYYLERYIGMSDFTVKDMMDIWFSKIAEKLNITDNDIASSVQQLVNQGFLDETQPGENSRYSIPFRGEQYVKGGFEG